MLRPLIDRLREGHDLAAAEIAAALAVLADASQPVEPKADFLIALATKGETPAEIHAFAADLRNRAVPVPVDDGSRARGLLDVVGTGGDRLGTINLSTAAAIVASAAGVPVAKHGNRAITSRSGSADVLQALGIGIEAPPAQAAALLRDRGFVFLFAPLYHPAFRAIGPARKLCAERGRRTLFNLLGPLLNPARPDFQLLGVPSPEWCEPLAHVLQLLGVRRGMVVCGEAGADSDGRPRYLDELSTVGPTTLATFAGGGEVVVSQLSPAELPIATPGTLEDLVGGDAAHNAALLRRILAGEETGPKRDAVLLNAAAALHVAGLADSILHGWWKAESLVNDGLAARKLAALAEPGPAVS